MDNRLFLRKCFICNEPPTEENPLYYYDLGDNTHSEIKSAHEKCWEENEKS